MNVSSVDGSGGSPPSDENSGSAPEPGSAAKKHVIAGPLTGLGSSERCASSSLHGESAVPDGNALPEREPPALSESLSSMVNSGEFPAAPIEGPHKLTGVGGSAFALQRMLAALDLHPSVTVDPSVMKLLIPTTRTFTIAIDQKRFHVQWCGPLRRNTMTAYIHADRFVVPDSDPTPDAVSLYAAHDPKHDVMVLWRRTTDEPMRPKLTFSVDEHALEEAAANGGAARFVQALNGQIVFGVAVNSKTGLLVSELTKLSTLGYDLPPDQDHHKI